MIVASCLQQNVAVLATTYLSSKAFVGTTRKVRSKIAPLRCYFLPQIVEKCQKIDTIGKE